MTLGLRDLAFLAASNTGPILSYPAYVQDYLDRVTAADVAAGNTFGLELGVTNAASSFLQDLVSISYLGVSGNVISQAASLIKAMPIMAGARTRAGALVPVVGPVPTEFGTAGGWNYNRKTGINGNGTDNYIDTGRSNASQGQNNIHLSIMLSAVGSESNPYYIGASTSGFGVISAIGLNAMFSNSSGQFGTAGKPYPPGFHAHSRSGTQVQILRPSAAAVTTTIASATPPDSNFYIFNINNAGTPGSQWSSAKVNFYSIGDNLPDVTSLEARVATLINAYSAAI